jgi:hypothetical protein
MGSNTDTDCNSNSASSSSDCDINKKKKCNDNNTLWKVLLIVGIIVLILVAIYLIVKFVMYAKVFSAMKKLQCEASNWAYRANSWADSMGSTWNNLQAGVNAWGMRTAAMK